MRSEIPPIFFQLQNHFNQMPVGYPATLSHIEVKLLMEFFSETEAQIALGMTYRYEDSEIISDRLGNIEIPRKEIELQLERMATKSVMVKQESSGRKLYALLPFAIGLYESKSKNLSYDFVHKALRYFNPIFGLELAFNPVSQFRQIPIEQSVTSQLNIATYEELSNVIHQAQGHIAVMNCVCRTGSVIVNNICQKTDRLETCLTFNNYADLIIQCGNGRAISEKEAIDIATKNERDGLVLQPENAQNPNWFCACCGDCCLLLKLLKTLPHPIEFAVSNYHAIINPDLCIGCLTCKNRCQMDAIDISTSKDRGNSKLAHINSWRCIGCGLCVTICPQKAIQLHKKSNLKIPPVDSQDLMEKLAISKRNMWQRIGFIFHLVIQWLKKLVKTNS